MFILFYPFPEYMEIAFSFQKSPSMTNLYINFKQDFFFKTIQISRTIKETNELQMYCYDARSTTWKS